MTRTCRLMYYMTLPVLYEKVTLRSYSEMRYLDGRPEGYGSGSPFAMGLSGLATGNSGPLVKKFTATGAWSEPRMDDYNKGKIPDSTILLGIALRAAIDKMTHLQSFTWNLDTKPTKSMYQGLAARSSLTSLDLRFPRSVFRPCPISSVPCEEISHHQTSILLMSLVGEKHSQSSDRVSDSRLSIPLFRRSFFSPIFSFSVVLQDWVVCPHDAALCHDDKCLFFSRDLSVLDLYFLPSPREKQSRRDMRFGDRRMFILIWQRAVISAVVPPSPGPGSPC